MVGEHGEHVYIYWGFHVKSDSRIGGLFYVCAAVQNKYYTNVESLQLFIIT